MNIRRFILTCALFCIAAVADQLPARTAEVPQPFKPATFLPDAGALPAFDIAMLFCLCAVLFWSLLWVSVLKLVRLDSREFADRSW